MRDYSFGNFLHELRVRMGLTQYQLGTLVGVSDKAVSKWENGSSKPQSSILYKLSEVLGISVDELLTCQYHSFEKKKEKGVFALKKQYWNKVFDSMFKYYGDPVPIEMVNRLLTEQAEMQETDMILYFDMLSVLASEARKKGEHICVTGRTGASFAAYLLGVTKINPLKPHYYCSACRKVIFDDSVADGWDLPKKKCSCGKEMQTDGHNIPFEAYRHVMNRNIIFHMLISREYLFSAKSIVQDYFKDCKVTMEEREPNKIVTFKVLSEKSECTIVFYVDEEFTRYKELEKATDTFFKDVRFNCDEVLTQFQQGNTEGIIEFKTDFMKNMLSSISPKSFRELIQLSGLSHGTGVWADNAEDLLSGGYSAGQVIAYCDDVFNYIQNTMNIKGFFDTGFAYKVMEDTRRGIYAKNGIPKDIKLNLKAIGMGDWFVNSIRKIKYVFPKAHGITYIKLAATLMWYKIHYPKEFTEIML